MSLGGVCRSLYRSDANIDTYPHRIISFRVGDSVSALKPHPHPIYCKTPTPLHYYSGTISMTILPTVRRVICNRNASRMPSSVNGRRLAIVTFN